MKALAENHKIRLLVLALLTLLGYASTSSRYFVSEDFLILRYLAETPFWEAVHQNLTGPMMGVSFVGFYRPFSLLLLGIEHLFFGVRPEGYLAVHFLFHLLNVGMLYRLVWRWSESREMAWGCALVFALYPLHLNTVAFIASFATLFGATLVFASLLFYEESIRRGERKYLWLALLAFALALCSYEQAAILPLLAAGRELTLTHPLTIRGIKVGSRRLAIITLPLGPYGLVRLGALGESIGGYSSFQERFIDLGVIQLGREIINGLIRLAVPIYSYVVSPTAILISGVLLVIVITVVLKAWVSGRRGYGLWLYGLIWILVTQVPFVFVGVVPGNGRYWYLTSVGLGIVLTSTAFLLMSGLKLRRPWVRPERFASLVATIAAVGYLYLLVDYAATYAEAGKTTKRIQARVQDLRHDGFDRVFLTGYPAFLTGPRERNVAQVFHWGLSDALDSPFSEPGLAIYPVSRISNSELFPILERSELGPVFCWHQESQTLSRVKLPTDKPPARIASRLHSRADSGAGIQFRPVPGFDHRLVLVTRGNASTFSTLSTADVDGWARAQFPEKLISSMSRLYEGDIFAWIDARDGLGQLRAVSSLHVVEGGR